MTIPPYPSDVNYAGHSMHPDWKLVKEWAKKIEALPDFALYQGIADLQRRVKHLEGLDRQPRPRP